MPIGTITSHTYVIDSVPAGCKLVAVGQQLRVEVVDPPPQTITLNYGGGCDGVTAVLVS